MTSAQEPGDGGRGGGGTRRTGAGSPRRRIALAQAVSYLLLGLFSLVGGLLFGWPQLLVILAIAFPVLGAVWLVVWLRSGGTGRGRQGD